MPEINPIEVIAECIEKCKATTDRNVIAHHISEPLGFFQVNEEMENDAFAMFRALLRMLPKRSHGLGEWAHFHWL